MIWFYFVLILISAYVLGSIPFGYLISKSKGIDIRKVGSGNIGATNVVRILGFKWGILVFILDVLKAAIPVYLATRFLVSEWEIASVALAAILGHIFSLFLSFKGGKGVSCLFGVLIVLLNWRIFLLWFLFWLTILAISKTMSFTNLLMVAYVPLFFWLSSSSLVYFILGLVIAGFIWWAHRENLKRMNQEFRDSQIFFLQLITKHSRKVKG